MVRNDLTKKYSKGTVIIHWLTAILIIALFPLGKIMTDMPLTEKMTLIKIHAILGIMVFILTIIRSYLFFKSDRPEDIKTGSKLNDKIAVWIHSIFYFLLLGIAISGIASMALGGYIEALQSGNIEAIISRDEIPPLKGHGVMALILMVLLVLHVIGVAKHYILTKENTIKRII